MNSRILLLVASLAAGLAMVLAGCSSSGKPAKTKTHHSAVYSDDSGQYYTRTYDSSANTFAWWVFIPDGSVSKGVVPSSGSWRAAASAPSNPASTGKAVEADEKGEPADQITEETPADQAGEVTTDTTEQQAETDSGSDSGGGNDGGGSDGGGDGGGSDGGGGDGG